MYFRNFFVLNRVTVSNPQRVTYTQIFVKYPPPPQGFATVQYILVGKCHNSKQIWILESGKFCL